MTTLNGMFDPKPRSQRNFLLENKRDVKTKSTSNGQKQKKELNLSQKPRILLSSSKLISPSNAVPKSTALGQRLKHREVKLSHSLTSQQTKKASARKFSSTQGTQSIKDSHSSKPISNSKTMHYIHKENVPFEWTEVCPSLISHNICHQGVQTDRVEKLTDECVKRPAQIHKHSSDNTSDSIVLNKGKNIDSIEDSGSEIVHDFEKTNSSVEALEGHVNKLNGPGEPQAISSPNLKSSNLISDMDNLKLSPSRKSVPNGKGPIDATLCPPSYRKGVVPGYISKRKIEALASARAKEVDPNCPIGHVVMPDDERRETLDLILKNYNQLIRELNKIPVRTDTLKMKQKKIEIEKQLDKLEEGIRIFSRSKVYVKLDA